MRKLQEGLAERGGFDPATKESGRHAEGPVKQQRGCSDDFQTYSIATDSNCRSKGKAMRTADINDFGGNIKVTFCCRNSDQSICVFAYQIWPRFTIQIYYPWPLDLLKSDKIV
jgi:hypothetical protein